MSLTKLIESYYENCDEDLTLTEAESDRRFEIEDGYLVDYNGDELRVDIPDSVTGIDMAAFSNCSRLEMITVDKNNQFYRSENNCLIEKSTNKLILGCKNSIIPSNVTSIGEYAFAGCIGLKSITIPDSVTSIGEFAFDYCIGLTSIVIPNSILSIDGYAFSSCTNLDAVYITDIAAWCNISFGKESSNPLSYAKNFYLNGSLIHDLVIPNSVTSIGRYTFPWCSGLTSVTIENGVISIGDRAFYGCSELKSIMIPESVTTIGDYAFHNCDNLTVHTNNKYVQNYCDKNKIKWKAVSQKESYRRKKHINEKLEIISQRERVEEPEYSRFFQRIGDYKGNGYNFPCDKDGNLNKLNPNAASNMKFCLDHPEEFEDQGVIKSTISYMKPAVGKCMCGQTFELVDEYMGACECPNCGRWYNLFGQELKSPDKWDDGYLDGLNEATTGEKFTSKIKDWWKNLKADLGKTNERYLAWFNEQPEEVKYKLIMDAIDNRSLNASFDFNEDTCKTKSGKWVNKGDSGKTHGEFRTKKEADDQREAIFASGWHESIDKSEFDESYIDKNKKFSQLEKYPIITKNQTYNDFDSYDEASEFCFNKGIDQDEIKDVDGVFRVYTYEIVQEHFVSAKYSFVLKRAFGKDKQLYGEVKNYISHALTPKQLETEYINKNHLPSNVYIDIYHHPVTISDIETMKTYQYRDIPKDEKDV